MAERQFHIIPVELYRPGFFSMTLVTHSIKKIFKYAYVHLNLKPSSLVLSITTTIFFGARLQISSLHTYASIWQKNGKVKYRGFFLCQSRDLFDHFRIGSAATHHHYTTSTWPTFPRAPYVVCCMRRVLGNACIYQ